MARPVYVVHCVDTEGPLHESVEATFERLKAIFGIDLEPSVALLRQLQAVHNCPPSPSARPRWRTG
jgi:hypothetical protein